ncbi:hypothetical protein L7F22_023531 [Adiantum nelumboides]|nr:hypothetical protein [Adiantum nelumboides]
MAASFDDQILQISELKHMEEKMFVVWDGNHRLHAWRKWTYHERLDKFSTPQVECTLVALNPTKMVEFLLVLSMINKVTRVHVPHTTAHDIFMMKKLGLADPKSILDEFDDEDRAKAKKVLHGTAMNRSKWLRLPMALLSQLLWKEEFDRMYHEKIQNLPARDTREYMDHEEDYEASYAMALKATESVFVCKGLEIAVIANLDNGSNFSRLCISFPSWGERGCKMTTFRVSEIACAHISSQEYVVFSFAKNICNLLHFGLPVDVQEMPVFGFIGIRQCGDERSWIHFYPSIQYTFINNHEETGCSGVITLANKLELENDAVRKLHLEVARESGQSIAAALQFYRAHHFNKAFLCWKANIKATNDAMEQPHFGCTVRRLLYRWWLGYILKVSRFPISEHSSNAWVDSEREETGIYPKDWIDDLQGTDAWRDCPWFLNYADGEFPDVEEGAYHAHHRKAKGKGKSFSATINQPKDAHSPSTAKGWPPRTAKGWSSTSKKRPCPGVSESSESLEEQFELLSREDAKDSRHVDPEQQSDSRRSSPLGQSRSQGSRWSSPSQQSRSQGSRWSSPAQGLRSRDSRARTSDTADRIHQVQARKKSEEAVPKDISEKAVGKEQGGEVVIQDADSVVAESIATVVVDLKLSFVGILENNVVGQGDVA